MASSSSEGSHGWQQLEINNGVITPTEIESLKSGEVIVSFNIASSTWKEVKLFKVNHERLRVSPSLLSELLSQTCMAAANDAVFLRSVMRRVNSHENLCRDRVLTLNMTLVNDDSYDGDRENDDIGSWSSGDEDDDEEACFEVLEGLDTMAIEGFGGCSENCTICLEEFEEGSEGVRMQCSHIYHRDCIFQWLVKDNYSCPLCRRQVSLI